MSDNVNHPTHYQGSNGIEAIDVIEGFELNYRLGNVLKYVLRCGKSGKRLEDLQKAVFYLWREIDGLAAVPTAEPTVENSETGRLTKPTIENVYGKPRSEIPVPVGEEFTGEFVVPPLGARYVDAITGEANEAYGDHRPYSPHLILRDRRTGVNG